MVYLTRTEKLMEDRNNFLVKNLDPEVTLHWGDYRVKTFFKNATTLANSPENGKDITLISQCSVDNLHYLIDTAERWRGPIAISIFAPLNDAVLAIYTVDALRRCYPMIRDLVTFHLVWPTIRHPEYLDDPPDGLLAKDCQEVTSTLRNMQRTNYDSSYGILYPHNTLRNVARYKLPTKLMFLIDIDTLPALNSRDLFLKFATERNMWPDDENPENSNFKSMLEKTVYVTPAWEVPAGVEAPSTKEQLLDLLDAERTRPFHNETCWYCHKTTRYEDWVQIPMTDELAIAYEVDWEKSWEPYYISTTDAPLHDERFKQYGYDRISQICELYMADYKFFILDNLFTVHQGYKMLADINLARNLENRKNFLIFEERFQPEMSKKYPDSGKTCVQKETWRDSKQVVVNNIEALMKQKSKKSIV